MNRPPREYTVRLAERTVEILKQTVRFGTHTVRFPRKGTSRPGNTVLPGTATVPEPSRTVYVYACLASSSAQRA